MSDVSVVEDGHSFRAQFSRPQTCSVTSLGLSDPSVKKKR